MGILNKIIANKNEQADPNKLSNQEIEIILVALKSTTLLGDQVEIFYNLIIKLQNQYINQQK